MYSRSFYPDAGEQSIPENYVGTAFAEQASAEKTSELEISDRSPDTQAVSAQAADGGIFSSITKLPILSGIFGTGSKLKMPKLGSEEILIIAIAALLFFSKNGDKECALILIGLLFIS